MGLHAFIAMPFGTKEGIDFNRVYDEYIKPALESAGFDVFRADKEQRAGNIRTDMFQELLLADLVVVDLSVDNPNVWYELGVRHGLRSRGVIQIQCKRDYLPFDIYVDRTLRYHIENGVPAPGTLEDDKHALATFAKETMQSWHGRKISPVYHLLRYLQEPDWKALRVEEAKEFWDAYDEWALRIEIARKGNRPGDILVFADEAPTQVLRMEAHRTAGNALRSLGQFSFALAQYEEALAIDPTDLESRQQKGVVLSRLKKYDEAKEWLEKGIEDDPTNAESLALLGRVEKDTWVNAWRFRERSAAKRREEAAYADGILREAITAYAQGFRLDPRHYYSGINAVTLSHLLGHLTGNTDYRDELQAMEGGVRWAAQSALARNPKNYWARVTLGDLEVVIGNKETVERAYKDAVAVADKDWFALDSSRQQLLLLQDLEFRSEMVATSLKIFDRALGKLAPPEESWEPRHVFLFSGHMIDAPDRKEPRFPATKEDIATWALLAKLDELGAGPQDLALCGGACGGDLIFAEACLSRGMRVELRIPFAEPQFLQASVTFPADGDRWRERFYTVKSNPNTKLLVMNDELGPLPKGGNPFARDNLWQLYTALAWGPEKVRFLCLWNRKGGDGPGGTQHMYDTVTKHAGQVHVLDTTTLW
ncbi:MAG: TRAFs-binding domain-containing protein [Candidatus Binatia bacterium]